MNRAAISLVLLALLWTTPALSEPTYGERLGWEANDRVLIIHCDDAGMSYASNRGACEALDYGLVTSVSVMMPCPWVGGFAQYAKANPNVDAGIHLTLTSEYDDYRWMPVAGKAAVPGLTDEQGCLPDGVSDVVKNATADEIETEIRAQVDRAETMGLPITHLDSHMGTLFAKPEFFQRYAKVGIEKGIPILIVANVGSSSVDPEFLKTTAAMVWAAGLPVLDYINGDSYDWKTTDKVEHYAKAIRELKPGITEMIIHCTKPDDVIGQINGNRDHLYGDYTAMIDPGLKEVIEEEGIILTTWRELKERRLAAKE